MEIIPILTKGLEKIASFFPIIIPIHHLYYNALVEGEIHTCNISCKDKVLCIGGGPLPCTAMEIARKTGAYVEVIDNDPKSVKMANRVLSLLNMDKNIKVIENSGQQVDASKYSVIHVARQVTPKIETFRNVWGKAPKGARILVRRAKDSFLIIKEMEGKANEEKAVNLINCRNDNIRVAKG